MNRTVRTGDCIFLMNQEEIVRKSRIYEWDADILFPTIEDVIYTKVKNSISIYEGIVGICIEDQHSYIKIITPEGIGWSRKGYWEKI
jgi:hypothetical protein